MQYSEFDLVEGEFNPQLLFSGEIHRTESENNFHSHAFMEIGIILEGEGIYHIGDEYVDVREGDVMVFLPGTRHESIIREGDMPRREFFFGAINFKFSGMHEGQINLRNGKSVFHTKGEVWKEIKKVCGEMETENRSRKLGRYYMVKSLMERLLILIAREQYEVDSLIQGEIFEYSKTEEVPIKLAAYLEEHFAEKISLDQIAEELYLSPFYISKLFKAKMGESPIHYLIRIRLEQAKIMLENEEKLGISQVAKRVGYDDAYHFSKLIKKMYGVAPSKIRKKP
ncbi:helix-turn-helix transcriptional regulator [Eubacterium xylanophilum]|uniref:helix-turn-helix transcriptional regulator n=1 Tax=Eubacterium xylanophilum TaxID=39497 RepID=UPI00047A12D0|nr:AraC family transcriptional regulator [Eubacterium xylanophilum]